MEFYLPRKLKFKAWNKETKLLMRLDTLPCVKGELSMPKHIFLQFTGMLDKQQEELYEMDVVFRNAEKYLVQWHVNYTGWCLTHYESNVVLEQLTPQNAGELRRLCSYFESR